MKIVIVGGVAGGASAAARARRLDENAEIILLQSGPDVSFASCGMPYFIGGEITNREAMAVQTPTSLRNRLNLDVRVNTRVNRIDSVDRIVHAINQVSGEACVESYDELVLAVGAEPFTPPIPGIERPGLFALRNLQDMDQINEWIGIQKPQHAVIAGAGFIGLEMVEQLMNRSIRVTLVELAPQILGPMDQEMAILLQNDLEQRGVDVITGDAISAFTESPNDPNTTIVALKSGRVLPDAHLTILGLGVMPDTKIIQEAGIPCTPRGHIIVDEFMHTSVDRVWAVGDAVLVKNPILSGNDETWAVPLAGPANRQGRMVADNIYGKNRKYKGTYGSSVLRCFDQIAACVGLNEKFLKMKAIPYSCVHIHPNNHAGYYPGATQIHLKVLFDKDSGKIYGAQAVGNEGVEKRIDVIATAMQGDMTVQDLAELELCYAPPVGSAKDPVNYAGMVAQNIMDGLVQQIEWDDFKEKSEDTFYLLDVRSPSEIASKGKISGKAINIPVDDLRRRLDELPTDKNEPIVVTCASGQRAYYGCRILMQNGYTNVSNLGGAYLTFHPTQSHNS